MAKYFGKFEDIFDKGDLNENLDLDYLDRIEREEDSKYWIHRTICPTLYFNPNYNNNGCPMILTQQELEKYVEQGKKIVECTSLSVLYSDKETKDKVIEKLKSNNNTEEELELQIRNKLLLLYESYIDKGIYMPDVYEGKIERTASQCSAERMKKIIKMKNFGFNGYRGEWNIGIILDFPIDKKEKVLENLSEPIKYGTEYYGETLISQVISPNYIKGIIAKFGDEVIYIKNDKYMINKNQIKEEKAENTTKSTSEIKDKPYLYQTEQFFQKVIDEYLTSSLPASEKAKQYVERMRYIENSFKVQVSLTQGFRDSDRYKEVMEYINSLKKFEPYVKNYRLGDYINQVNEKNYYENISNQLDEYISIMEKKDSKKIDI